MYQQPYGDNRNVANVIIPRRPSDCAGSSLELSNRPCQGMQRREPPLPGDAAQGIAPARGCSAGNWDEAARLIVLRTRSPRKGKTNGMASKGRGRLVSRGPGNQKRSRKRYGEKVRGRYQDVTEELRIQRSAIPARPLQMLGQGREAAWTIFSSDENNEAIRTFHPVPHFIQQRMPGERLSAVIVQETSPWPSLRTQESGEDP
eukprot:gene17407-biopygen10674